MPLEDQEFENPVALIKANEDLEKQTHEFKTTIDNQKAEIEKLNADLKTAQDALKLVEDAQDAELTGILKDAKYTDEELKPMSLRDKKVAVDAFKKAVPFPENVKFKKAVPSADVGGDSAPSFSHSYSVPGTRFQQVK